MKLLHRSFKRVGVVNRGEPAVRFLRAARAWSARRGEPLEVVALFTNSDRDALFVRDADSAVCIGDALVPGPDGKLRSAYLDVPRMIATLKDAGCDAVWPGWGFVSENAQFADACAEAGLVFIGPSGDSMRALGDKIAAKALAEKHGVPVTDWSRGPVTVEEARQHATRIGFPVLLKAAAGGGGRGIRIARDMYELEAGFESASNEARSAFGDATLLVEAFVAEARHVEVQVIADSHGNAFAVGTRDCSMQRRHQKVLEEAPAPFLSPALEKTLRDAAISVAKACGYVNAGTAEFLVLPDGSSCAFLEMNTRLQVEHPVTECVTGVDLVGAQIDVARGETLRFEGLQTRGHSIEARLCAEDPDDRFTPSAGRLLRFDPPHGPGIRVDSGFAEEATIPGEFDSMLAKVIATGATREEALARLGEALTRFTVAIEGGASNRSLLIELVGNETFRSGPVTTRWLDRYLTERKPARERKHLDAALVSAAISEYVRARRGDVLNFLKEAQRGLPSNVPPSEPRTVRFRVDGSVVALDVVAIGPRRYRVSCGGRAVDVRFDFTGKSTGVLTSHGRRHQVVFVFTPAAVHMEIDGVAHRLMRASDGRVVAPVPAAVTFLHVKPGDVVKPGQRLVTLEVMKMEVGVEAPVGGRVARLFVDAASRVAAGDALVAIEAEADGAAPTATTELSPFDPETTMPADEPADPVATLLGAVLGYDHPKDAIERAIAAVRTSNPPRNALFRILEAHVARETLFERRPGSDGVAAVDHLASYLRLPRARGDGLPEPFLARLRSALAFYEVHDLAVAPPLESALLRMSQAHKGLDDRDAVLLSVLAVLERDPGAEVSRTESVTRRTLLESFAALATGRNPRLAEAAWVALYALCDHPRELEEGRALTEAASHAMQRLVATATTAAEREAHRAVIDELPLGTLLAQVETGLEQPQATRAQLLDLLMARLHPGATRTVSIDDRCTAALYDTPHRGTVLALLGTCATIADDLARVGTRAVDVTACEVFSPRPTAEIVNRLETMDPERLGSALPSTVQRVSLLWGDVERGRLGRTFERNGPIFTENPFFRDFHPARVEMAEIARFSAFELEKLPSSDEIFLALARSKQDPNDERFVCLAEIERVDQETDPKTGRTLRVPSFERAFHVALKALREAQAKRPKTTRLYWNRLILFVRPPLRLSRAELEGIAARLIAPTAGVGLEKVVVRADLQGADGTLRPVSIEWTNPTGSGVALGVFDAKSRPIRTISAYERRVVETRRRGVFYPYELVRALAGQDADAAFPPGSFHELDLDAEGRLVPVSRPYGGNTANLVVGLVENRFAPFEDGLRRVLLVGDPTRGMGSLAEAECRRIIAAFELAEERGLPVEWVPVSSGAKIAMDSGTENLDWTARVLAKIVRFTQAGGVVNVIVDGICVGAQSYWNAEATMLMHCRGALIMTPHGSMLLTGKKALEFAGSVAAEDNLGIGGFERIMGPNGEAQYFAPDLVSAYQLLFRHYAFTHVAAGEQRPRNLITRDPAVRDATRAPYAGPADDGYRTTGDLFDEATNPGRKRPFAIRALMRAVLDEDVEPLERWAPWQGAESAVVWDGTLGGTPVSCIGIESKPQRRRGDLRADGPDQWTSGTLFPLSSKKVARALSAASGVRPVVVLANLSGFDGSPDSLRNLQLEYGAEIGRAVVNFKGPLLFCVVSRYHGGAYVVFSRALNEEVHAVALQGSFASVIGGASAAAVVFPGVVKQRAQADERVVAAKAAAEKGPLPERAIHAAHYEKVLREATTQAQVAVAKEFDAVHTVERARQVGSLDAVIPPNAVREYLIGKLRG